MGLREWLFGKKQEPIDYKTIIEAAGLAGRPENQNPQAQAFLRQESIKALNGHPREEAIEGLKQTAPAAAYVFEKLTNPELELVSVKPDGRASDAAFVAEVQNSVGKTPPPDPNPALASASRAIDAPGKGRS